MSGVSFILHIVIAGLLSLTPWPIMTKARDTAYTVTLISIPIQEPEVPNSAMVLPDRESLKTVEETTPVEKPKLVEKPKKDVIVEKVKKNPPKKVSTKHLQDAIDEIRKKAALDAIQRRMARRETGKGQPTTPPSNAVSASSSKPSDLESKRNEYYNLIWSKIKEAWTIPENLLNKMVDLETIIVVMIERDGKIQRCWFEKKSGNALYDQTAMRAIKKAEPLPPIPKEFNEDILEIGIRFFPE